MRLSRRTNRRPRAAPAPSGARRQQRRWRLRVGPARRGDQGWLTASARARWAPPQSARAGAVAMAHASPRAHPLHHACARTYREDGGAATLVLLVEARARLRRLDLRGHRCQPLLLLLCVVRQLRQGRLLRPRRRSGAGRGKRGRGGATHRAQRLQQLCAVLGISRHEALGVLSTQTACTHYV